MCLLDLNICHTKKLSPVSAGEGPGWSTTLWIWLFCVFSTFCLFFLNRFNSLLSSCQSQAISSSWALSSSVQRDHGLEVILPDHWRASLLWENHCLWRVYVTWSKCCFRGFSTPAKNMYYIYHGGNTGLKCLWIYHLLSYRIMWTWDADHYRLKEATKFHCVIITCLHFSSASPGHFQYLCCSRLIPCAVWLRCLRTQVEHKLPWHLFGTVSVGLCFFNSSLLTNHTTTLWLSLLTIFFWHTLLSFVNVLFFLFVSFPLALVQFLLQ